MKAKNFCNSQCSLGEGPLCTTSRLVWFDILQSQVHFCDVDGQNVDTHQFSEMFSAAANTDSDELLLASESALWTFSLEKRHLELLIGLEADDQTTRSNDGRADRQGGFWISTMGKNAEFAAGSIYRLFRGELVQLKTGISIPNAICFSPEGNMAYFADSLEKLIYRWNLDKEGWPIDQPEIWLDLSASDIDPDGAIVDSQGFIWNAQWDGARVVRYDPDGSEDRIIELPVSRPTCPAFSQDGNKMFITSARDDLSPKQLEQQPLAGNVFVVDLDVPGLSEPRVILL